MKMKCFVLASGTEEGCGWEIATKILKNGTFFSKGNISIQDKKLRNKIVNTWIKNNPEKWKKSHTKAVKKWIKNNPKAVKKFRNKRRGLGFEPLNKPFEGAEAHHITKDMVVYIPKEIHRSVTHNIFTGKNMDVINGKTLVWVGKNA